MTGVGCLDMIKIYRIRVVKGKNSVTRMEHSKRDCWTAERRHQNKLHGLWSRQTWFIESDYACSGLGLHV